MDLMIFSSFDQIQLQDLLAIGFDISLIYIYIKVAAQ